MTAPMARQVLTFWRCDQPQRGHSIPIVLPIDWDKTLERAAHKLEFMVANVLHVEVQHGLEMASVFMPDAQSKSSCGCGKYSETAAQCCATSRRMPPDLEQYHRAHIIVHVSWPLQVSPRLACIGGLESQTEDAKAGELLTKAPLKDSHCHEAFTSVRQPRPQQKMKPRVLRHHVLAVWAALDSAGVYVPPLPENPAEDGIRLGDTKKDKFYLERHGHGRGNTKSIKKRSRRMAVDTLGKLLAHLEDLATTNGVCLEPPDECKAVLDEVATESEDSCADDFSSSNADNMVACRKSQPKARLRRGNKARTETT